MSKGEGEIGKKKLKVVKDWLNNTIMYKWKKPQTNQKNPTPPYSTDDC